MSQYDWLPGVFGKTVFTVFDTETTGLDPKTNRIVEIGGIRFDSRGIIARFNTLINPNMPMPAEAARINGITDEMLKNMPPADIIIPDFCRFIGSTVLLAHNSPFDISFLNEELARLGRPGVSNKVIDTRIFAKEVFPEFPKFSLQELALRLQIEAKDAHRAEDDARVCMELFLKCLQRFKEKNPHLAEEKKEGSGITNNSFQAKTEKIDYSEDLFTAEFEGESGIEEDILDEIPD